ncbi:UV damage repair endonuclease UvdE [Bacillus coahuilensis p1.1.43]|uniref:UV damage repair endonuclease UvdE n=2 Tax=Bacillus coahuilensis TaxID=408580 RepID=A0A147K5H2_9BACI|nr:UV damage repair endonuclease UvdE [Bacillus coahuilensis p1.1.43]
MGMIVRLGYVAMSLELQNASPSQTMTYKQFSSIKDRAAALRKLERIATSNLHNCLRLLKHNALHSIEFFRFSSKLIPLANHPDTKGWRYMSALKEPLNEIKEYLQQHPTMRVDFHPDHFVLLNSTDKDIMKNSLLTLQMHRQLLEGMGIDPTHRCVLHVGGGYDDKEKALEQFIHNWGFVPTNLQEMIILENDDTVFTLSETLYLCEKLGVPCVFDYHHHLANKEEDWTEHWDRVVNSWSKSPLPVKIHISSPRSPSEFRAHAEYVDVSMFFDFLDRIKDQTARVDCMIEAKGKDLALFQLIEDIKETRNVSWISQASFEY